MDFLLARQPIYDRSVDVIGYELLFRHNPSGNADVLEGTDASAAVSVHALLDVGLDRLVGKELAFVNATAAFLTSEQSDWITGQTLVVDGGIFLNAGVG